MFDLLEADLLGADLKMVERQAIDKVLKEQQLSALSDPNAVGARVQLGRMLKADVLVMLTADAKAPNHARLVVCESSSGIRTAVRNLSLDGKPEAVAGSLAKEIATAVAASKKVASGGELCGIPPFISKDLVYDFDAMKGAYATLTEQAVISRVGIATVELAEAQALERELILAGQAGKKIERPLPLYILGQYRNDGRGDARRVSIELVLKQGERELLRKDRKELKPDDVPAAISELVEALFANRGKVNAANDPAAEVKQLERRAGDFSLIGEWAEAVNLYEACLLLDPGNRAIRLKIIDAMKRIPETYTIGASADAAYKTCAAAHAQRRRLFYHTEQYARRFPIGEKDWNVMDFGMMHHVHGDDRDPRIKKLNIETGKMLREIVLGLIHDRLASGAKDSLIDHVANWFPRQIEPETVDEAFEQLLTLVTSFKGFPKARKWTVNYLGGFYPHGAPDANGRTTYLESERWEPYLKRLETSGDEALRLAAGDIRKSVADRKADSVAAEARNKKIIENAELRHGPHAAPTTRAVARFLPIDLRFEYPADKKIVKREPPTISGWIPATRGIDVIWGYDEIFLMTEPGVARAVWSGSQGNDVTVHSVSFDGKYVWASVGYPGHTLIVIDPATGKVSQIGKDQGLLPANVGIAFAPLEPGRVCIAGGFRPPNVGGLGVRGWCAIATFDPATGGKIDVFHEASRVIQDDFKEKLAPADVGFFPGFFVSIGSGANRRLILSRRIEGNTYRCFTPPMIVDPEKKTVTLWEGDPKLPGKRNGPWSGNIVELDGALYFPEPAYVEGRVPPKNWKPKFFKATGPQATIKQIGQLPPIDYRQQDREGEVTAAVVFQGRIYLSGPDLFQVDLVTGASLPFLHAYPDKTAGCKMLALSHHYGMVTWRDEPDGRLTRQVFYKLENGTNRQ